MTIPESIPISSIQHENRTRVDYSDTDGLCASLKANGTIQPIVLEQHNDGFRLVAGGRRLTFLKTLGHTHLWHGSVYQRERPGFVLGTELSDEQLAELELEENIRRKQMSWQEECLSIAKTHRLRSLKNLEQGLDWLQSATGRLLNMSTGAVSNALWAARELQNKESPLWKHDSLLESLKWKMEQEQIEAEAELARRSATATVDISIQSDVFREESSQPIDDERKREARERYLSNPHNDPEQFESYWNERQVRAAESPVVYLSNRLFNANCLDWLRARPSTFNHIITDPPYAIDMDNLDQENQGMSNIDSVRETHGVDPNKQLLLDFIPLAYDSIKESGFLILWCDQMLWEWIYDIAIAVGFKVQRWPITWVKTHPCMNSAAQYNFTKTTEIAMVCRKGSAMMIEINTPSHIIASSDEFKDRMDHPFVKPFEVWRHLIEAVSIKGQSICDPFMGEGSATISMMRLERNFFGCELDPVHYNRNIEHMKQEYLQRDPTTRFL